MAVRLLPKQETRVRFSYLAPSYDIHMKFLRTLNPSRLKDRVVVLRIDLNIEDESIRAYRLRGTVPFRVEAALSTLRWILASGAKAVIVSHRGRPSGASASLSLKPFAAMFASLLRQRVAFLPLGARGIPREYGKKIREGRANVYLLENVRFLNGEKKNHASIARQLASLGDYFVNDAFAVSHRSNASVDAITRFLPSFAGLLFEAEIAHMETMRRLRRGKLAVILGGAKIADKIGIINKFLPRAEWLLLGGAASNTIFYAKHVPVGDSLYDRRTAERIRKNRSGDALARAVNANRGKVILPVDSVISEKKILDIGHETSRRFAEYAHRATHIIWNGPLGYVEDKRFQRGTREMLSAIVKGKAYAVIGGGETSNFVVSEPRLRQALKKNKRVFLSTGGGAMLAYLSGKKLPGVAALER